MAVQYNTIPALTAQQVTKFWKRVKRHSNGCWEWQGAICAQGYGKVGISRRGRFKTFKAHRLAYAIYYQSDPGQLCVCHHCDNPSCVNPLHFFLGTYQDNARDRESKHRRTPATGDQHGSRKHPERVPRGEKHGRAKLKEADVRTIRQKAADGNSLRSLSREYQLALPTICQIVRRESWKHI